MKKGEAKGLLVLWSDIDEVHRMEYQKWHNCQHMTERVTIPGFHVGRRYRGIGQAQDFLMTYETDDAGVLKSEPYIRSLNNPTPWSREIIRYLRNTKRGIYRLLSTAGKKPITDATYVYLMQFNIPESAEVEVMGWYRKEYMPQICVLPGVDRGRLYEMDAEVSNIMTGERKIHGGGPGEQKYLSLFEMESSDLAGSKEWEAVGRKDIKRDQLENITGSLFWLDFTMYAPGVFLTD